jgi:hypothetical protein
LTRASIEGTTGTVTKDELEGILAASKAKAEEGWQHLPEGNTATFQIAKDGVGLSVTRAVAVKQVGEQLQIRTEKGETCFVPLSGVFACIVDGGARSGRRAGFAE